MAEPLPFTFCYNLQWLAMHLLMQERPGANLLRQTLGLVFGTSGL